MADQFNVESLKALLEADLSTLYRLVNTFGPPVAEGDVRAASAILRRWLCEGLFGRLCNTLNVTPTFPVLDNSDALALVLEHGRVEYFLTAGVKFAGHPVMLVYSSPDPPDRPLPLIQPNEALVRTKEFLSQRRIFFEGQFVTTEDVIRFMANKLGGVHLDAQMTPFQQLMLRASEFMTFGGPAERVNARGLIHMALETEGKEVLNGFHLEVVAAAASFIQVYLDGTQLVELPRQRPTLWARVFGVKPLKVTLSER